MAAELAVPPGVVTDTVPVEPAPTTADMLVELITVKDVAAVPPKLTADAPVKLVPVIIIVAPEAPKVGAIPVTVGAERVKVTDDVAVPPGVVTETVPVVPLPTTAVILVALATLNDVTGVPPRLTAVAPVKLVPVMVMVAPTVPLVTAVMVGAALNAVVL